MIRDYLHGPEFLEVETPMMHPIPGGATAKPFKTHHNALAWSSTCGSRPSSYLKRLVVGRVERVFEINRNFRNEGISAQHNPEFTMLEFYQSLRHLRRPDRHDRGAHRLHGGRPSSENRR